MTPEIPVHPDELALRDFAIAYPETTEDFPWGHRALKVRGKMFALFGNQGGSCRLTAKLPVSNEAARGLPFAEPTGYGLGKAGWMTARFESGEEPPIALLQAWIDESYRAVAPKRLVKTLPPAPAPWFVSS